MNDQEKLLQEVLQRIKPTPDEQQKMQNVADNIISLVDQVALELGLSEVNGLLVGSAARSTWITGEHDLDIFISFPEETTESDLKTVGLEIARKVAENANCFEERYAEHPYIHANFNDFEVDLVPCFRVSSAAQIKSAVDRTPFHNQFILSRIKVLENDVLLLKQFMKGAGVYGSDLKTGGFSGYLAELLIIHYSSFLGVVEGVDDWKPGTIIDLIGHGNKKHNDPLVVVDPTDPGRNVAAALSLDKFAKFIVNVHEYLESPTELLFFPVPTEPIIDKVFEEILVQRGTSLVAIVFDKPDVVDDILYPQLFMLHKSIRDLLERHDFTVLEGNVWAVHNEAAVVLELLTDQLPSVKKHMGPPVWSKSHAKDFKEKHMHELSGFYIENGRYMVDIPRKYTLVTDLIRYDILSCKLGKHVGESIRSDFRLLQNTELLEIKHASFREFLTEFFHVRNPSNPVVSL
jgi:tRNA nucleotidyltransferase (CCA-adding enzyme)